MIRLLDRGNAPPRRMYHSNIFGPELFLKYFKVIYAIECPPPDCTNVILFKIRQNICPEFININRNEYMIQYNVRLLDIKDCIAIAIRYHC